MPRSRGGTLMPSAGAETVRPSMLIVPAVGSSSPATQRNRVLSPQPEGPSSTTISPAGTLKLTPSTAGRPPAKTLSRSRTSSVAAIACLPQTLLHHSAGISCHCEPSGLAFGKPKDRLREAIPLHLHMTGGGDFFVGLRPPRNDKEIGLLTP